MRIIGFDEAMKLIEENRPPVPEKVLQEFPARLLPPGGVRFTGWKAIGKWGNMGFYLPEDTHIQVEDDEKPVYCAQWVYRLKNGAGAAYCNLPGMETGTVRNGEAFSIGDERMKAGATLEEVEPLIQAGYEKIMEFVNGDQ